MFRRNLSFLPLLLLLVLSACQFNETYSEFRDFPEKGWNRYDTLFFSPKIETSGNYNLFIDTRNNNLYPYQNLWLFISCKQDSITLFTDTVEIELADKLGNWHGSGWGSLYEYSFPYKMNFHFPVAGKNYTFKIVQGMRDYELKGIESAGFHIEKAE